MAIIIGTAGHIDHGKTTLIQSLTGVHLDSSPEEKERGITISLGFTEFKHEDLNISFVDVPGHERLIRTMISGATGLHGVLICISAVDSVMPQTIEHLEILNLLGIQEGIIAITMCDLADEDDLELIREEIAELVIGTFLESAPIIETSSGSKPFGQQHLIRELLAISERVSAVEVPPKLPFRLPVDRCFSQKGFGTVVTGTSRGLPVSVGDIVEVLPQNIDTRIRDIQSGHNSQSQITTGQRVALNLVGVSTQDIPRGSVVVLPNTIPMTQIIDCSYTHLRDSYEKLSGCRIRMLFGSSEVLGKVYLIDDGTKEEKFIQIRLDSPHVICKNDRYIIRRESPLETLGGGIVVDPYAIKIRSKNRLEQLDYVQQIYSGKTEGLLDRMGIQGRTNQEVNLLGIEGGVRLADKWYSTVTVQLFAKRIEEFLVQWHKTNPLRQGVSVAELKSTVPFLDKTGTQDLLQKLFEQDFVIQENSLIRLPKFRIQLSEHQQTLIQQIESQVDKTSLEGLSLKEVNTVSRHLLNYILENARLIRVGNQLIHPRHMETLESELNKFFQEKEQMTTADFKTITQLSRKFSIPLLEWMDENQKTLRRGDVRLVGTSLSRK